MIESTAGADELNPESRKNRKRRNCEARGGKDKERFLFLEPYSHIPLGQLERSTSNENKRKRENEYKTRLRHNFGH